jgi:hypothetical protein
MGLVNLDLQMMVQWLALLQLLSFIIIAILWVVLANTKKKMKKMFKGSKINGLEDLLIHHQERIQQIQSEIKLDRKEVQKLFTDLGKVKGRVGLVRYNAFHDLGSDLSFSVAILNNEQTGLVLTGLHNREQTYMYAKPVTQGESNYTLSPEEKEAIKKAFVTE